LYIGFDPYKFGSNVPVAISTIAPPSLDTSYTWKDPIKKLKTALDIAIKNSPQCNYPIDILHS
jgi:hypothetical protein